MLDIRSKVSDMLNLDNQWDRRAAAVRQPTLNTLEKLSGRTPAYEREEQNGAETAEAETAQRQKANPLNIYLKQDGSLVNPYIDYQKVLNNPNVSQTAKGYITEATGLTPAQTVSENESGVGTEAAALTGNKLGFISAKYETGGWNPGLVSSGAGDYGGVSYGIPQFSTNTGSAAAFVKWLKQTNPEMGSYFGNAAPGSSEFGNAWKQVYEKYGDQFGEYQTQYAYDSMVQPLIQLAKEKTGIDYSRSPALRELVYSTAIQFGGGSLGLSALGNVSADMSDEDIINASYDKKINNYRSFFKSSSGAVQESVKNRFMNEWKDVLSLSKQKAGTKQGTGAGTGKQSAAYKPGNRVADTASYHNDAAKGQCVWYVRGRVAEKLGKSTSAMGNANQMYYNAPAKAKVTASAANLRPDMIVSYQNGTSAAGAKYGHVIYIEDVVGDTVYYTEGGSGYYQNGTDGVVKTASRQDIMNGVNANGARIGSNVIGFIDANAL